MNNAQSLYTQLESDRLPYLERGRDCARLTIPTLLPDEGVTDSKLFDCPYQSLGARGVNHLASALLLSLLPPNAPFFRLVLDNEALKEIEGASEIKAEIEQSLSSIERSVMREIETNSVRVSTFEAIKHLIVTGNVLLYLPPEGSMRVFHLNRFVIERDPMGNPRKIITKESVAASTLPEEIIQTLDPDNLSLHKAIDLYTCIHYLPNNMVEVYQEIGGKEVPNSRGTFPKDKSPYIILRMNRVEGEHYGRSFVEQYLGDLKSLEALTQAIVEGTAASAKVLFLVNPNGTTRARTLAQSDNGAIVEGNAGDVSTLQVQKQADFQVALSTAKQLQDRLAYAFMLTESTIRDADRVTAAEIRLVTQSLERSLGGIYSLLSQEFQLPLVNRLMGRMSEQKKLPKLPKKFVTPAIVTGIEALGRGNDLDRLDLYLQGLAQVLGPDSINQFVNVREYLKRRASALGIDINGLIKSEEQIAQEIQEQQQQALIQQFGPQALDIASQPAIEQ
tara:strand:- start:11546 stop:13060 length:1515 start_codon:yes stop_codon:yes gene_type:complete